MSPLARPYACYDAIRQSTGSAFGVPSFYNRGIARRIDPPPPPRAQRAVVVVLLAQVALAALMPALPTAPGAVRVAGVNLLWWYTGLLVPVLSVLAAAIIRR